MNARKIEASDLLRSLQALGFLIAADPERCRAAQRENFVANGSEVSALSEAVRAGVPTILQDVRRGPLAARAAQFATVNSNVGLADDSERWAAACWAVALGLTLPAGAVAPPVQAQSAPWKPNITSAKPAELAVLGDFCLPGGRPLVLLAALGLVVVGVVLASGNHTQASAAGTTTVYSSRSPPYGQPTTGSYAQPGYPAQRPADPPPRTG